jgi:YebC/PmpR family DNA-binding regulatory protein
MYEGYGPHGVAVIVQVVTDNRNRAVSEIRRWFTKAGGSMAAAGAVAWQFEQKGYLSLEPGSRDPDEIFEVAVEWGAEDVIIGSDLIEIYTPVDGFQTVREALEKRGMELDSAELTMVPKTTVSLGEKETFQNMGLISNLEDLDDVQQVYSNLDLSDELMAKYEEQA